MKWGQPWGTSAWGGLGADTLVALIQRSESTILTIWSAWWGDAGFAPEAWQLGAAGDVPAPVIVGVEAATDPPTELLLTADQPLLEGVTYTLTPLATLGGVVPDGGSFVGKQVSLTQTPDLDLLDLDANPFESYRITPGGDHGMAAGFATFRKLVIDRLLTVRGSVPWDPDHGSNLPHKQPRPLDLTTEEARIIRLLETVPGMLSVGVALSWDGQQLVGGSSMVATHDELYEIALAEALFQSAAVSEQVARAQGSTLWWELNSMAAPGAEVAYQVAERFRNSFLDTATGPGLDRLVADRYNESRQPATAAVVELTFTRITDVGDLTIPAGTTIQTEDQSLRFRTERELQIPDGSTVGSVRSTSTALGSDQAAAADTLIEFSGGVLEDGLAVTNVERSAGGNDRETDGELRARVRGVYVNAARATLTALVQGAHTVEQVRTAAAYETTDASGCPVGAVSVVVADAAGNSNSALETEVEETLEEWRAAGIPVEVIGGVRVERDISVRVVFESNTSTEAALLSVRRAIVAFVNRLVPRSEDNVEDAIAKAVSILTPGYVESAVRTVPRVVGVTVLEPAATEVPEVGEVFRTSLGRAAAA
jgi:uncharacterized phage protein gp47/JayE